MAIFKRSGKKLIDYHGLRFLILFIAAGAGYFLSKCGFPLLDCWLEFSDRVDYYLEPLLFGLPVFICLWYFRTYDTQQQIQQGNFVAGMDKLVQDDPAVITVGVKILLQVSAKTDSFDDEIRDAFIQRIKIKPTIRGEPESTGENIAVITMLNLRRKFTYAQHILHWLITHQNSTDAKPDLYGMRCENQEFRIDGLCLGKILPRYDVSEEKDEICLMSFAGADCETLNFAGINLALCRVDQAKNCDFTGSMNPPEVIDHPVMTY